MILYVNGDGHTAAAEAVNQYSYTHDDPGINYLIGLPHPENLSSSWGKLLSLALRATFFCDAKRDATNTKILTDAKNWLADNPKNDKLVVIQWMEFQDQVAEHEAIWQFHQELLDQKIIHIFFNGDQCFDLDVEYDWGVNYIEPYDPDSTFSAIIRSNDIDTVSPDSKYFGKEGHSFFNHFVLKYIIKNNLI